MARSVLHEKVLINQLIKSVLIVSEVNVQICSD